MRDANENTVAHKEQEETSETPSDESELAPILKKQKINDPEKIMYELGSLKKSKIERSEILLDLIMKSDLISIEGNNVLQINQKSLDVKVSTFFCIIFSIPQKK